MVRAGAGAGAGAELLTSWSRTKMDRLRNTAASACAAGFPDVEKGDWRGNLSFSETLSPQF
jgi:hypothetical protein